MSKSPKIDITKSVMSQIESGEVKMRPKAYFTLNKTGKIAGIALVAIALLFAIFYAVVIIQNGVFQEYFEFGKQGASAYYASLPWGSITISILLTAALALGIYLMQQKKRLVPNIIGVAFAVITVATILFKISPDPSNNALARAVMNADGNPTKIAGTVQGKDGNKYMIKMSSGEIVIVEINSTTMGERNLEAGDEVIVLGNKQNGSVNADAVKKTKSAEKKMVEIKQEQPTKIEPETKPEESKPEQKPTAIVPAVSPQSFNPAPPPAPIDTISITQGSTITPTKIQINVSINYTSSNLFKVLASTTSSAPVYPTDYQGSYFYVSTGTAVGYVKNLLAPNTTYFVRVCEHNGSVCVKYSNLLSVTFP